MCQKKKAEYTIPRISAQYIDQLDDDTNDSYYFSYYQLPDSMRIVLHVSHLNLISQQVIEYF
jgi:hypothetical protein